MARGEAYCVELGTNITLKEAHAKFFEQPEEKRRRFTFMCGDPKCRAVAHPKIVGAVYDRADAFDAEAIESGRHRPPYYRSHARFPHIDDCTWHEEAAPKADPSSEPEREDQVVNDGELGLIGLPETRKRAPTKGNSRDEDKPQDPEDESPTEGRAKRPDSTRFLATVGMNYLTMTVAERQNTPLRIDRSGIPSTFYSTCLPIFAFHPAHQSERIYHGLASIDELTNVFMLTFQQKFSPTGARTTRHTLAKVKFLKRALDEEDRQLAEVLKKAVIDQEPVYCFIYSAEPPEIKPYRKGQMMGTFHPAERDHVFIVPQSMVTVKDPVDQ
ncbi:hypothetical protein [Burkholderia vietnamiensis]|uniref:hypothetical protein n=1 Tax=Burkholderia vietnamiensis TaxID=60552 RepID=UPI000A668D58|nr:hypothetical protein [Burkholderia vietnamiensis]